MDMQRRRGRPPKVAPVDFPAVEVATVSEPEPEMTPTPEAAPVWIFKSHMPFTLIARSTIRERQVGPDGVVHSVPLPPIKVVFTDSTLTIVVDERLGKQLGQPPEYLAKLMLNDPACGRSFKLIWGPGFEPDEALLKYSVVADELAIAGGGVTVTQGIRTTGNIGGKTR